MTTKSWDRKFVERAEREANRLLRGEWEREHVRIEPVLFGGFMIVVNGYQWGGNIDSSGAGDAEWSTAEEAIAAYREACALAQARGRATRRARREAK